MKRIAQITNYPTRQPRHGGQLRAHHTARVLERAGYIVERVSVFSSGHYPPTLDEPTVDLVRVWENRRYPFVPQISDLTGSELAATDARCFASFAERLERIAPHVIMVEEPWLWPAAERWRSTLRRPPPIVFNAHNVESHSKAAILADLKIPNRDQIVGEVESLEKRAARNATGVSATTTEDVAILQKWTDAQVVVAGNGATIRDVDSLYRILPSPLTPVHRFLLFVGSAHPPNAAGFMDLILPTLPLLRANERIVVAGGVCDLLACGVNQAGREGLVGDRLVCLGQIGKLALDCLFANARGILLPITYGGGSNLKTAEALISGLPIVGTSRAFRGFGDFAGSSDIIIAETPDEFGRGMRYALGKTSARRPRKETKKLLWEETLQPIVDLVRAIQDWEPRVGLQRETKV